MQVEIKNLKTANFASDETLCFEATVYADGKKLGTASNDGRGACNMYHGDFSELEKYAVVNNPAGFEQLDAVIMAAVDKAQENKSLKRWCKKELIFTLKNDEPGNFRTIKIRGGVVPANKDKYRAHMKKTYGNKLVEFINERFWK